MDYKRAGRIPPRFAPVFPVFDSITFSGSIQYFRAKARPEQGFPPLHSFWTDGFPFLDSLSETQYTGFYREARPRRQTASSAEQEVRMLFSVIICSLAVLFAILSVLLLTGRGAFLISGYNTASPAQKATYDEKRLCRVTGGGLFVISLLLFIMGVLGEDTPRWFTPVFITVTVLDALAMALISNSRYCRTGQSPEITEADRRRNRRITLWSTLFSAVILALCCVLIFTGSIVPEYGETAVVMKASYWPDLTIRYDDISHIELRSGNVPGTRTGGFGGFRLLMGNFRNEEFGAYTRYTYANIQSCIVLTDRGKTVVLSGMDDTATRALYDALCLHTGLS